MVSEIDEKIEKLKKITGDIEETDEEFLSKFTLDMADAIQMPELLIPPIKTSPWLTWKGKFTLFVGASKYGKSWISSGDSLEALRQFGSKSLYITIDEPTGDLVLRFSKYQEPRLKQPGFVRILHPDIDTFTWEVLERLIKLTKPNIVYLDSWDALVILLEGSLPDAGNGPAWRGITQKFVNLARKNECGMCMLIHTLKSDPHKYAGSGQVEATADIKVTLFKEGKNLRKLTYEGRVTGVDDVELEWMEQIDGSIRETSFKIDPEEWLLNLMDNDKMYSTKEMREAAVSDGGPGKTAIEKARAALLKDGFLEKPEKVKFKYRITQTGKDRVNKSQTASLINQLKNAGAKGNQLG